MSIEAAIKARLDGFAGLRAEVKTRNYLETRPARMPLPATTLEIIGEQAVHAMGSDAGIKEVRIQVNSFADNASKCREVDEQVRQALSRYRGTSASVVVQDILELTMNTNFHAEVGSGVYQRARDFRVWYEVS